MGEIVWVHPLVELEKKVFKEACFFDPPAETPLDVFPPELPPTPPIGRTEPAPSRRGEGEAGR